MTENITEIVCVLDRSGSMESMKDEPIGGFNRFIEEQKELEGEAKLTLVLFDDQYDVIHDGVDLKEVPKLTKDVYWPRGMTALLDAVGKAVNTVEARLSKLKDEYQPEKVIVVILTDGLENSSHEFKKEDLKKKIEELQKEKKWEFIFMGSELESFDDARGMGLKASMCDSYQATSEGLLKGYVNLSRKVSTSRTGGK